MCGKLSSHSDKILNLCLCEVSRISNSNQVRVPVDRIGDHGILRDKIRTPNLKTIVVKYFFLL